MNLARYFLMILGLMLWGNACDSQIPSSAVPPVSEKETAPATQKYVEDCFRVVEKDFAQLLTNESDPASITDIISTGDRKDFKEGIDIKIKNVSDKTIRSLSIAPQFSCTKHLMLATPLIQVNAVINQSETFLYHLPTKDSLFYFEVEKCKDTILNQWPKPRLSVEKVSFTDGSSWEHKNNTKECDRPFTAKNYLLIRQLY